MSEVLEKKFDLEDRLIDFAVLIVEISENLNNSKAGNHIAGQLVRSGISPALNYGEAQSAESRDDFVHKIKIILKELKESRVCLKLIIRKQMIKPVNRLTNLKNECEELIKISSKSIDTAKKNNKRARQ